MRKLLVILATTVALATPALAADLTMDSTLGTTMDAVKASLTEMGYEVRKSEMEDGRIEVYFVKDGKMGEGTRGKAGVDWARLTSLHCHHCPCR